MAFQYRIDFEDTRHPAGSPSNSTDDAVDATLVYDLGKALDEWSKYIEGAGTLVVKFNILNTATNRADASPTTSYAQETLDGRTTFAPASLYKFSFGSGVAGAVSDITVNVSPDYLSQFDLSPNLTYDSTVRTGSFNPIVIFMHEIMHGLGQSGFYRSNGEVEDPSPYDKFLHKTADGKIYYTGMYGSGAANGNLEITSSSDTQNYYHYGNTFSDRDKNPFAPVGSPTGVQDPLTLDLMAGVTYFYNYQYKISEIDLGVLRDIGYTVLDPQVLPTVTGDDGANALGDGGLGAPKTMVGLGGNDTYLVDDPKDVLMEATGGGADLVITTFSYALTPGQEIETLRTYDASSTTALRLAGNELAQAIYGNAGDNTIDGMGGIDTMTGYSGNDEYYVDNTRDVVNEQSGGGSDVVRAGVTYAMKAGQEIERLTTTDDRGFGAINLAGNDFDQSIVGNYGANVINGKGGADTMTGLFGNDIYYVDNSRDEVDEQIGDGTDKVITSVNYALKAGQAIEAFTTSDTAGTAAIVLTGNDFAQSIVGNAGADIINGRGGADTMNGLGGDDIYYVDNARDVVKELAGGGSDQVFTSGSYALAAGQAIEFLTTNNNAGTAAVKLIGNDLAQTIFGSAGANVIDGKGGRDTLLGGGGRDVFKFDTALSAPANVDFIVDFTVNGASRDLIDLSHAIFSLLPRGELSAQAFHVGVGATTADQHIVYNSWNGALIYDTNGNAAGGATQFATLAPGLALTAASFHVG